MEAEPMEAGVAADELRRVELTDAAANLLRQLTGQHGPGTARVTPSGRWLRRVPGLTKVNW
jgi:hypothetical protein